MSDVRELYQELILDHSKKPRNFSVLENANHLAEGFNPLCGDRVTVYVNVEEGRIRDVTFQGSGCAISKASASLMTASIKGKTVSEVEDLSQRFRSVVTGKTGVGAPEELGKLAVFNGVSEFPARVKCATLAWHTLGAALERQKEPVSTE